MLRNVLAGALPVWPKNTGTRETAGSGASVRTVVSPTTRLWHVFRMRLRPHTTSKTALL